MSSTLASTLAAATATAAAAAESSAAASDGSSSSQPSYYKYIGLVLAILSGITIGLSFTIKKKGLINVHQKGDRELGEGHAYLKSPMWWTGMIMMAVGEIFNFAAYAFASAILVTPMGALSVVVCAVASAIFLKERLTFFGKIGCFLCVIGSAIIALNAPEEGSVTQIRDFQALFLSVGFLVYGSLAIAISVFIVFYVGPRWGKKYMLVYISVCSLIGGLSVACTTGLGAVIVTSIKGDNQFTYWFTYFLLVFVTVTLLIEINYLNKALALFGSTLVTAAYFVLFTACSMVTSAILYQGFHTSATNIVTIILAFITTCTGITLLQISRVEPEEIKDKLDRSTTMLVAASRAASMHRPDDEEKVFTHMSPGPDAVGGFGTIGSIHRALSTRRSQRTTARRNHSGSFGVPAGSHALERHQLYDSPMPSDAADKISLHSSAISPTSATTPTGSRLALPGRPRGSSVTFAHHPTVHGYMPPAPGDPRVHERDITSQPASASTSIFQNPSLSPADKRDENVQEVDLMGGGEYDPNGHERYQTLPREAKSGVLASILSSYHSKSTPDVSQSDSGDTIRDDGTLRSPTSRFGLPHFHASQNGSTASGRSARRPHGPRALDMSESESLVPRHRSDDEGGYHDEAEPQGSPEDVGGPIMQPSVRL